VLAPAKEKSARIRTPAAAAVTLFVAAAILVVLGLVPSLLLHVL
jgi:hypothetical protein